MSIVTKRSAMTLFSDPRDQYSHRVRLVLAEKGVTVDIVDIVAGKEPEDLAELNPYNTLPTLADRDLALYEANVIMEYLDERFPHPPLFPVYPVARAKTRLMIFRLEQDFYSLAEKILKGSSKDAAEAREELSNHLLKMTPAFKEMAFFLSQDFFL